MTSITALPSGINIELSLVSPVPVDESNTKLSVLLHPWSWLGGRMNDPLLQSVSDLLHTRGYHVLRFNSRGVGRSTGRASFTGVPESQDLRELIDWALTKLSNVKHLLIIGYSYGSLVCSRYLPHPTIKTSHILISYPLGPRFLLTFFHSSSYENALASLVNHECTDILILYGDQDEFTGVSEYNNWMEKLNRLHDNATSRGRLQTIQIAGGTHFWRSYDVQELLNNISSWLDNEI